MYVLGSDITVGSFRFGGVHEVRIRRSVHGYVDSAVIKVPSMCRLIDTNGKAAPDMVITGKQFEDGDKVTIKLGYNGELVEEFRGFVKRRNLNIPLEIECEGYSYQLRRNHISGSWKSVKASELLQAAVKNTDVTVHVENDLTLTNVLIQDCTGAEVIDFVIKQSGGSLNAFFIQPDKLWVGLMYLPNGNGIIGAGLEARVEYRLGWNVIKDNSLRERIPNVDVEVRIKNKKTKRTKGQAGTKAAEAGKIKNLLLQHVSSNDDLGKLKATQERRTNYTGYEGKVTTLLLPFAAPAYKAFITDTRYKERDGVYFIESTEVIYGMGGARRLCEIGPKLQA